MSENTRPLAGPKHGSRRTFRRILRNTLRGHAAHENTAVLAVMNICILLTQIWLCGKKLQRYALYLSGTFLDPQHIGHYNYSTPQPPTLNRWSTQRSKSGITTGDSVLIVSQKIHIS